MTRETCGAVQRPSFFFLLVITGAEGPEARAPLDPLAVICRHHVN